MDSRVPKNEREWWASREIEKLERELAAAKAECERLKVADCIQCDGKGWYADGDPERPYQQQCQACNGTGMHETYRGELTRLRDEVETKDDCDA
jgi:DnaJ-class molecular chaperone